MHRRSILLCAAAALPLAACGAFTVSGKTVTVDFAKLSTYAQAVQSGVGVVLGIPGLAALLPPGAPGAITVAAAAMVTAASSLAAASGGAQTLSYDVSSLPAALTAFEADAAAILGDLSAVFGAQVSGVTSQASTVLAALKTVLLLARVVGMPLGSVGAPALPMPESKALGVLLPGTGQ